MKIIDRKLFTDTFASAEKENNRWVLKKDHAKEEMKPYKRPFIGSGVFPDVKIKLTHQDLTEGKDSRLDYGINKELPACM